MARVITPNREADRTALCACWNSIAQGRHDNDLPMKGYLFQDLIIRAFELEGAGVVWPYTVQFYEQIVEQIDGVVYADGISCMVESKCEDKPSNIEPIAKLRNQLAR